MSYVVSTKEEQLEMLKEIGVDNHIDLYKDAPKSVLLKSELDIPEGISEFEVLDDMKDKESRNKVYSTSFRGAGSYKHLIPEVVKHLSSISGFVTSYTPYQAEISQGNLQAIFEYQTEICSLCDLYVSNSSIYDGASACGEALIMSLSRKKNKFIVSKSVHPNVLETLRTYSFAKDIELIEADLKDGVTDLDILKNNMDDTVAGVLVQSPNFYGLIEDLEKVSEISHEFKAFSIAYVNPISLAILKTPGSCNVDIACGDGQPLGLDQAFGGPSLGFLATTEKNLRKVPGRIVGETVDSENKRMFVLTLQAREQHIRREKASSSLCSNQALAALRASVYLGAMGKKGLEEVASYCLNNAHYCAKKISELDGYKLKYDKEFFNEFVVETEKSVDKINKRLRKENIQGPYKLDSHTALFCVTEANTKKDIDKMISILKEM